MKRSNAPRIAALVLIDAVIFAACLLSFAWFHHAKRMLAPADGDIVIGGGIGPAAVDSESASDKVPDDTEAGDPIPDDTDSSTLPPVETEPETEAETEPPVPQHKFESMFAAEGEFFADETSYKSHDISIEMEEITREFNGYTAKYLVFDVYVRNVGNLYTVNSKSRYDMTELCEAGGAIAAISGDFWYQNAHIAVRGGELLRRYDSTENDFLVMYTDGRMETFAPEALDTFDVTSDIYQIWNFGPSLLDEEGHAKKSFGAKNDIAGVNPRSSIGYYEPYHYCFVVADGRRHIRDEDGDRVYSGGVKMRDLALIYEELGCVCAYNLDGGNSAYAYFNGEIVRQQYVDEGKSPRKIYDIICIGEIGAAG